MRMSCVSGPRDRGGVLGMQKNGELGRVVSAVGVEMKAGFSRTTAPEREREVNVCTVVKFISLPNHPGVGGGRVTCGQITQPRQRLLFSTGCYLAVGVVLYGRRTTCLCRLLL